jgi:hypothetical protein
MAKTFRSEKNIWDDDPNHHTKPKKIKNNSNKTANIQERRKTKHKQLNQYLDPKERE